jgi:hypothetical protein
VWLSENDVDRIKQPNHTSNQIFTLHPPTPGELFGLALEEVETMNEALERLNRRSM